MPRIPTYDAPQIEAKALPGPYQSSVASPDLFGEAGRSVEAFGRGMVAGATGVADVLWKKQQDDDLAKVTSRFGVLQEVVLGAHLKAKETKLGELAIGYGAAHLEAYDKAVSETMATLDNEDQKKAFGKMASKLRLTSWNEAAVHEINETGKFRDQAAKTSLNGAIDAGANAVLGDVAKAQLDTGKAILRAHLASKGISQNSTNGKPVYDEEMLKFTNTFHSTRIQVLLSKNNLAGADAYFKSVEDSGEIDPTAAVKIRNALKDLTGDQAASDMVDDFLKAYPNASDSELTAAVRTKVADAQQEKKAVELLKTRLSERDEAKKARIESAMKPVYEVLGEAHQYDRAIDVKSAKVAGHLSVLKATDSEAYSKATTAIDQYNKWWRSEKKAGGVAGDGAGRLTPQDKAYHDLYEEYLRDPEAFAKNKNLLIDKNFTILKSSDKQEIQRLKKLSTTEQAEVGTLAQQLSTAHGLAGWGSKDAEIKGKFDRTIRGAIAAEEAGGKKLDYIARQKLIDRMLLEGEVKTGSMWRVDRDVRAFEVHGTAEEAHFVPDKPMRADTLSDVPRAEQNKIKEEAARRKITITPQEIIRKYNQLHGYK